MSRRRYSVRKARHILRHHTRWYRRYWKKLTSEQLSTMEELLERLDEAVLARDRDGADTWARRVESFGKQHCTKSMFVYVVEVVLALVVALAIATVIRQMWFEPFHIPTGSMRPTFKEKDRLLVTKTSFGLNIPLNTGHFYFNPDSISRGGVVIWSGENVDLPDTDTRYFGIFPCKKRYIKRLIGKPGDSLYFYGGQIYGVDRDGNDLAELRDSPWMQPLEHVPFTRHEDRVLTLKNDAPNVTHRLVFRQMNQPTARLSLMRTGDITAEVFDGTDWVKETPPHRKTSQDTLTTYGDFLGVRNYAMARLLTAEEVRDVAEQDISALGEGVLYLQLAHNASLTHPEPRYLRYYGGSVIPLLTPYTTIIPLQEHHLRAIMENMYTARFVVSNHRATRYRVNGTRHTDNSPTFSGVANDTYEFYYGKATKVGFGGITTSLADDHPLYRFTPENVQRLFNLGIDFNTLYEPLATEQDFFPLRYAYFRDGDLYLMGAPVIKGDDPILTAFHQREQQREQRTTPPYVAFKDYGPPLKDGKIDVDFIRTFGLTIPDEHYILLGDNHAMSADSRTFGFVHEGNLEGSPSILVWPPQDRFGPPPQAPYSWVTLPSVAIWTAFLTFVAVWLAVRRRQNSRPIFHKVKR